MNPNKLKLCPFCNGKPEKHNHINDKYYVGIGCDKCGYLLAGKTWGEVIDRWSTRPKPSVKWPDRLERCACKSIEEDEQGNLCGNCLANAMIDACQAAWEKAQKGNRERN